MPVDVSGVTKCFRPIKAVDDLSFALPVGSITGFLGPNGAGKTTTLRMIGGLLRPTRGRVTLFGLDAAQPAARRRLGYMPADPVFLRHLSGRANLDLLAGLRGRLGDGTIRTKAAMALGLTDAELDRPVGGYSSGMRQKLAVVATLQHGADLVVLDEPANRLDPLAHHIFCGLLRDLASRGATVLLSSHVLAEVEAVCDTVLLVREGRLLKVGPVDELRDHAARTVNLVYRSEPTEVPDCVQDARIRGPVVTGRIPAGRPDVVRELVCDDRLVDLTIVPMSLEDVVLDLYSGGDSA